MKLINNMTNFSNTEIGRILDYISKTIDTIYYGKKDIQDFNYMDRHKKIRVEITYLKRYTRFDIYELKDGDEE